MRGIQAKARCRSRPGGSLRSLHLHQPLDPRLAGSEPKGFGIAWASRLRGGPIGSHRDLLTSPSGSELRGEGRLFRNGCSGPAPAPGSRGLGHAVYRRAGRPGNREHDAGGHAGGVCRSRHTDRRPRAGRWRLRDDGTHFATAGINVAKMAEHLQREGAEGFVTTAWKDLCSCMSPRLGPQPWLRLRFSAEVNRDD